MEPHKVMEVMMVTTKHHHRHQYPLQTLKQQETANLKLKPNLKQEATRVMVNSSKEVSMVATNSNKVMASNRLETGPSSSTDSRNHPSNNSRDNMVSNPRLNSSLSTDNSNRVMVNKDSTDNSKVMDSNLNRVSMVNSRAAMESHQHLRAPASSQVRDSSSMANRAKTKDTVSNKDSNRIRGMVASRETRVKATDSSRAARTRNMASNRVKDTVGSNKTRVMVSKGVREVTAREGPMLETVETRVEGQVMVTTSPGTITRGETALRPTGVAEDLMVEMTVKEGMTIEEAEEMTEEVLVVTAEEAVTWTDKVVLTGEITTEATIEEDMTTGKEGMIIAVQQEVQSGPPSDTIFVSGLPKDVSSQQIGDFFGQIGIVKKDKRTGEMKIYMYNDKETGAPKGE